jgi:hypothetical protein
MRIICCLVVTLLLAGCAMVGPPDGWRRANMADFTVDLPSNLVLMPGNTATSRIEQYQDDDMIVTFDEGAYAGEPLDSLGKYKNYATDMQIIHGIGVQLVTFDIPPGPGHRFDYAAAASYRGIGLTVYIHCKSQADYKTATKIFKSLRSKVF